MTMDWPRIAITASILALFAYAIIFHFSTGVEETLKSVVMIAVGFWLGSSKSSGEKDGVIAGMVPQQSPSANDVPIVGEGQ